jgi:hypothetical protein
MEPYKTALADYISVLEQSSAKTNRAEDRSRYQKHLASAALMFCVIQQQQSVDKLRELVAAERRSYGWDFLDGPAGKAAESAFHRFAQLVEHEPPQHNK